MSSLQLQELRALGSGGCLEVVLISGSAHGLWPREAPRHDQLLPCTNRQGETPASLAQNHIHLMIFAVVCDQEQVTGPTYTPGEGARDRGATLETVHQGKTMLSTNSTAQGRKRKLLCFRHPSGGTVRHQTKAGRSGMGRDPRMGADGPRANGKRAAPGHWVGAEGRECVTKADKGESRSVPLTPGCFPTTDINHFLVGTRRESNQYCS